MSECWQRSILLIGVTWEQWILIIGHKPKLRTWYWISALLVTLHTAGSERGECTPPGRCCASPGLHFGKHASSNSISRLGQVTSIDYANVYSIIKVSYRPVRQSATIRASNSQCQMSKRCRYRPPFCRFWARLCVFTLHDYVQSCPAV